MSAASSGSALIAFSVDVESSTTKMFPFSVVSRLLVESRSTDRADDVPFD